jgi:hypothetical protein
VGIVCWKIVVAKAVNLKFKNERKDSNFGLKTENFIGFVQFAFV